MYFATDHGRPLAAIMAAALLVGAIPGGAQTLARHSASAVSAGATVVQIATGRGRLITLAQPMSDLFVADENVADVQVRSPTQIYVYGKKPGETTVSATTKGGQVVFAATVRIGNNFDSLGGMLAMAMPDAKITATPMNGLVLLTGTVAAPEDAAEAERLVQAFVGETTKVLSRLKTATPLQVNLQVRIAEVSRSFVKNVGVNLTSLDRSGGFLFGIGSGRTPGTITPGANGTAFQFQNGASRTTLGLAGNLLGLDLLAAIDLGETIGQVTTLANPNLTALSGETATFLAGGEFPIPISQGLGAVSVEYKQYGVSLAYTPTVLSDGRISLRVRPEVSQLTSEGSVQLSGTTIPGLTTRRAETTLELGSGQSMMIGGLLQNSHNNSVDKTPGLGSIPIIGALFRSNAFRRSETELVIIITPYLVKPVNNAADIALPTDGYQAASDVQQVLLGKIDGGYGGGRRPVPTVAGPGVPPTIGAAAPAMPLPTADRPRPATRSRPGKRDVAPGFSN
ncbi:type II and III secretion system protein family protein [uncultured Sphingomonas sp.]|uniref:type II and III secretion system protein family protein n=1 Tax=uncultured Sphingomonas sp. TaxID=158754 RepID=UPI0035CC7C91